MLLTEKKEPKKKSEWVAFVSFSKMVAKMSGKLFYIHFSMAQPRNYYVFFCLLLFFCSALVLKPLNFNVTLDRFIFSSLT